MATEKPELRFPSPFWEADEVAHARFTPKQLEEMVLPAPRTVMERKLDRFTTAIRDKPCWWEKVFRSDVVQRWESEALEQDVDSKMFHFALEQLRHQAGQCGEDGIRPSAVPGVFESDEGLGEDLRQEVLAALQPLRDAPDDHKDWHPGSNQQVLDLVHPSLFPLVYGLSRRVQSTDSTPAAELPQTASADGSRPQAGQWQHTPPHGDRNQSLVNAAASGCTSWYSPHFGAWKTQMGAGEVLDTDAAPASSEFMSDQFQWLPADVLVGADGRCVFDSYINNMHPGRHAPLYAATVRLLERMLPLLERMLAASTQRPQRVAVVPYDCADWWSPARADDFWEALTASGEAAVLARRWRAERDGIELPVEGAAGGQAPGAPAAGAAGDAMDTALTPAPATVKPPAAEGAGGELEIAKDGNEEDESEDSEQDFIEFEEKIMALHQQRRVWAGPALPERFEPPPPPPRIDLRGHVLQVIVKYAEIVLTPEQPEYGGGTWHVEGMENEAIVASCIAYLSSDNISESRLHFRTMVTDPDYEQNDDDGTREMYGMENEGPMNEALGSVLCAQGRMLCWPNAFQHRVAPFHLVDPSRPGRRTFVSVFLVHPGKAVTSTRDVPPQQLEWHDEASQLGSLVPPEVKRKVDEMREFPISLERAKELRLELMDERSNVIDSVNEEVYERQFSLCEH